MVSCSRSRQVGLAHSRAQEARNGNIARAHSTLESASERLAALMPMCGDPVRLSGNGGPKSGNGPKREWPT
jgi:hypothetical protein